MDSMHWPKDRNKTDDYELNAFAINRIQIETMDSMHWPVDRIHTDDYGFYTLGYEQNSDDYGFYLLAYIDSDRRLLKLKIILTDILGRTKGL